MRARIWGARGSLASPGADTVRHGGNTSCVEVQLADGTLIVLDAGTGIRGLGERLAAEPPREIHLCLTHLHLDHLEGLPFFAPLWQDGAELHVWGPPSPITSLAQRVARYLSPPLFPRSLADVRASVWFHDAPEGEWPLGDGRIVSAAVVHPGPTVGYRIEEGGRSLTYLPDHEPALAADLAGPTEWLSGYGLAAGADVLLHDAQFFPEQYDLRIGWGHCRSSTRSPSPAGPRSAGSCSSTTTRLMPRTTSPGSRRTPADCGAKARRRSWPTRAWRSCRDRRASRYASATAERRWSGRDRFQQYRQWRYQRVEACPRDPTGNRHSHA